MNVVQNAEKTPKLMEAAKRDMHLKIVVNVHLATSQKMENVVTHALLIFIYVYSLSAHECMI